LLEEEKRKCFSNVAEHKMPSGICFVPLAEKVYLVIKKLNSLLVWSLGRECLF